jgi:hypothetical protein
LLIAQNTDSPPLSVFFPTFHGYFPHPTSLLVHSFLIDFLAMKVGMEAKIMEVGDFSDKPSNYMHI